VTKAKSSNVPALRAKQILKRWTDVGAALDDHGVTPDLLVSCVKKLLKAEKRVVSYNSDGRESHMVPDANAVKNGIELAMELMGLRSAKGFEEPSTGTQENMTAVAAVVSLTAEKVAEGVPVGTVQAWLGTDEGTMAVRAKMDSILADGVVDV